MLILASLFQLKFSLSINGRQITNNWNAEEVKAEPAPYKDRKVPTLDYLTSFVPIKANSPLQSSFFIRVPAMNNHVYQETEGEQPQKVN